MIIDKNKIEELEQRYRTTLINSLAGFRQAVLVGTQSSEGHNNLAIFNSLIHLGAHPALYGLINRPDSVQRDTLQNIISTKAYTLNYVRAADYKRAHQTSARYDKQVSEFEAVGLEAAYLPWCTAPIVKNAVVSIAMQLEEIISIAINGTVLIVGSVQQIHIDEQLVGKDGFVSLSEEQVVISQGLDAYFVSSPLGRLAYAKP